MATPDPSPMSRPLHWVASILWVLTIVAFSGVIFGLMIWWLVACWDTWLKFFKFVAIVVIPAGVVGWAANAVQIHGPAWSPKKLRPP